MQYLDGVQYLDGLQSAGQRISGSSEAWFIRIHKGEHKNWIYKFFWHYRLLETAREEF